jgi:two-component system NtrC family response regulator/two-component system response regulator AtoC
MTETQATESKVRVLLVDDEHDFVEMLATRMRARGLRVETAESGEEAIDKVGQGSFHVVVLDLAMPGMDGIETFERITEIAPDIQVIFLTGHGTIQTAFQAMKQGAADFLEKPASFQELFDKVNKAGQRTMLLVQERAVEQVADILTKKGWG